MLRSNVDKFSFHRSEVADRNLAAYSLGKGGVADRGGSGAGGIEGPAIGARSSDDDLGLESSAL